MSSDLIFQQVSYEKVIHDIREHFAKTSKLDLPKINNNVRTRPAANGKLEEKMMFNKTEEILSGNKSCLYEAPGGNENIDFNPNLFQGSFFVILT